MKDDPRGKPGQWRKDEKGTPMSERARPQPQRGTCHYFVDEAGDLTLFDRRGRELVGQPGVSRYFMLGVAFLPDPALAYQKLEALRAALLSDPYFRGVPSMQPGAKRTALAFHATDDVPEVRREVFKLLPSLSPKVQVVVRTKSALVTEARALFAENGAKLREADIYDDLVKRLFRNLLHKADDNVIVFARRGKAARKEALEDAIRKAKRNFAMRWGKSHDRPTAILPGHPPEHVGLQVIDYYLWALQRCFEANEDRYFSLLADHYRLIVDFDDKRQKGYGTYYTDKYPLSLEKIKRPQTG